MRMSDKSDLFFLKSRAIVEKKSKIGLVLIEHWFFYMREINVSREQTGL